MSYKIFEAFSAVELETTINRKLFEGWKLIGGVSICSYIGNNKVITHYTQAMCTEHSASKIQNEEEKKKELKSQYKKIYG